MHAHFSSVLTPCFSLSLQSFSHDHSGFFFSSKNERKLSSEVDALEADLDLLWAELETERQVHQKEEKTLRARVVETEKQRDAAVESAKNECKGVVGSAYFFLYFDFFFFADLFLGVLSSSPS